MKLQNKFLIPIVSLILVGMVSISVILFRNSKEEIEVGTESEIAQIADALIISMDEYFDAAEREVNVVGDNNVFKELFNKENENRFHEANEELLKVMKYIPQFEAISVADKNGKVIASNDTAEIGTMDISDRDYFKTSMQGNTVFSDAIISKLSGNPIVVVATPVIVEKEARGVLFATISLADFNSIFIDSIVVGEEGYAYILDKNGIVLSHPDKSNILRTDFSKYDFGKQILLEKNGYIRYEFNGIKKAAGFRKGNAKDWIVVITANDDDIYAGVKKIEKISIVLTMICIIVISGIVFFVVRSIVKPLKFAAKFAEGISEGDLTLTIDEKYLKEKDEVGDLSNSLNNMKKNLESIVINIMTAAQNVTSGSEELSRTAQKISQGATEQAASGEEISSSMEEMSANVRQSVENAEQTKQIAQKSSTEAAEGGMAVKKTVEAMKKIAEKISIVEEIARNTNLLSLNAAIEAARAGELGKGFAVVASEVKKLAANSQKASAEINILAIESVEISDKAGAVIEKIIPDIKYTADLVEEISASSDEQNSGIMQINDAVMQLDEIIQQNAAASEESAAMAEELASQAEKMEEAIAFFKINNTSSENTSEDIEDKATNAKIIKFTRKNIEKKDNSKNLNFKGSYPNKKREPVIYGNVVRKEIEDPFCDRFEEF